MDILHMQTVIDELAKTMFDQGQSAEEIGEFLRDEASRIEQEIQDGEF